MDDLISRQAAIDAVNDLTKWYLETYHETRPTTVAVIDRLTELPSAQKHGKWLIHPEVKNIYGGTYIECSECREKYVVQYIEDEKFCRNCGAKMEGDGDGI